MSDQREGTTDTAKLNIDNRCKSEMSPTVLHSHKVTVGEEINENLPQSTAFDLVN